MKDLEKIEKLEKARSRDKILFVGGALLAGSSAFASGTPGTQDDSFGELLKVFSDWMQGNLGKLLALIGFAGTVIVYMMTHKGSVLFIGIVITLILGGMVGISQTFFNAGASSFDMNG